MGKEKYQYSVNIRVAYVGHEKNRYRYRGRERKIKFKSVKHGWLGERIFFAKHARDTKRENVSPSFFSFFVTRREKVEEEKNTDSSYTTGILCCYLTLVIQRRDGPTGESSFPGKVE